MLSDQRVARKGGKAVERQLCGVHFPCPVGQVVCLVNKVGKFAALGEVSFYIHLRIEKVVEVADDNVTYLGVTEGQLVRADAVLHSHPLKIRTGDGGFALVVKGHNRIGQPCKIGKLAIRLTGFANVSATADGFLCGENARLDFGPLRGKKVEAICRSLCRCVLGGEVKDLLAFLLAKGTQGGVNNRHGLARSGRE